MPSYYKSKEIELRSFLSKEVGRGKMELSIYVESLGEESKISINQELAVKYHNELKSLADNINESGNNLLGHLLRMPDVMKAEREEINDNEWTEVHKGINNTLDAFNNYRAIEGEKLFADFKIRIEKILALLSEIEQYESERIEKVKSRITQNLEAHVGTDKIDNNRFEQELIFYMEKFDITEEKVRLKAHCDYFIETANEKNSQGKKLGFITQEIGREINTIGSKSNHAAMQKAVVLMKDELEKIKEQSLNIL